MGGFAGNIALLTALIGAAASGNDEAARVMKDLVVLPTHATFDGIILVGALKLRSEAEKGVDKFIFHDRKGGK